MLAYVRKFTYLGAFYALSLAKVVNGSLGVRSSTYNGYQWDEIMSAMSGVFPLWR